MATPISPSPPRRSSRHTRSERLHPQPQRATRRRPPPALRATADELKIEATTDATIYKPGDDARIHFHVSNAKGAGVSAALGLQVVDEAVFALAEQQPGFAKVFFYLEQEAMKPRYEIHSLSMSSVVEPASGVNDDPQDRAAQVLFSATEMPKPNQRDFEFGRELPTGNYFAFVDRYQKALNAQVKEVSARLNRLYAQKPATRDAVKLYKQIADTDGAPARSLGHSAAH